MDDSEKFEILSNFVSDLARSQRTIEESLQPVKKDRYLFRGLRADGEGWAYGGYFYNSFADQTFIVMDTIHSVKEEVIHETVGQWTGLVDKNGVKIFEGDIVVSEIEEFSGVIRYTVEDAGYSLEMSEENRLYDLDALYTYEVIGNIHQK